MELSRSTVCLILFRFLGTLPTKRQAGSGKKKCPLAPKLQNKIKKGHSFLATMK